MAYINVMDWKCDQVIDWVKGLDSVCDQYIQSFQNNQVGGKQLLDFRASELESLGVFIIGHQEIFLEALEHLKNFHFNIDKENLQYLALQVHTASTSLFKQLICYPDKNKIETKILNDVSTTISKIVPLVNWLDRPPFQGHMQYFELRTQMLRLGLELATISQRDRFVENPVEHVMSTAKKLSKLSEYIIQDITDPMLLQPSYLDIVTFKKKENELGFFVMPNYRFNYRISDIKYNSPAHNSGKIEEGDEIMQINYQTVVGWQYKKVVFQLQESTTDVLLTLRKRPKHTKIYGQIYLIKLPSKKRSLPYRVDNINIPSPRINMNDFVLPSLSRVPEKSFSSDSDSSDENDSVGIPVEEKSPESWRIFLSKPRPVLQRRHTLCGDDLLQHKNIGSILWHERKSLNNNIDSPSLRDKSISFGFGLEIATRPATCMGINDDEKSKRNLKISPDSKEKDDFVNKTGVSKLVRFESNSKMEEFKIRKDSQVKKFVCKIQDTIIESFLPIPFVDEDEKTITKPTSMLEHSHSLDSAPFLNSSSVKNINFLKTAEKPAIVPRENTMICKSFLDDDGSVGKETPPAVEPKHQVKMPPVPPPRPKKTSTTSIDSTSSKAMKILKVDEVKPKLANVLDLKKRNSESSSSTLTEYNLEQFNSLKKDSKNSSLCDDGAEITTPNKSKMLTIKKKNSLLAKRRKVSLKTLSNSVEIQGYLYRRSKDKNGVTYWAKYYFVLLDSSLYGFKCKESKKAECLIFLSGFTVSLATEVHSKQYAFKVYHPLKTFYFASETYDALLQWTEYIKQATLKGIATASLKSELKLLYSETECSDDGGESKCDKHSNSESVDSTSTLSLSSKSYHLTFGSLKKFAKNYNTNSNSHNDVNNPPVDNKFLGLFSNNKSSDKRERATNDVPIPTEKYKSYKKVQGGNNMSLPSSSLTMYNMSLPSTSLTMYNMYPKEMDISKESLQDSQDDQSTISRKNFPHNYIHASNPNLVEFDKHYSKNTDFVIPKINNPSNNSWDANFNNNTQQIFTLKDLMLQKQAEEAKDMYDKQVFMGFENPLEIDKAAIKKLSKSSEKSEKKSTNCDPIIQKIQERSLPVTPDYAQSFKPDDQDILYTRSKEGQKLRDFGYELISGEDSQDLKDKDNRKKSCDRPWNTKRADKITPSHPIKTRSFNWSISQENDKKRSEYNYKIDSDPNLLKFNSLDKSISKSSVNKALSKTSKSFVATAKKPTNTNYLSKITINRSKREKSLLGSPKIHRAIFGRTSENYLSAKCDDPYSHNSKNFKMKQNSSENLLNPSACGMDYYDSHMELSTEDTDVLETDKIKDHE